MKMYKDESRARNNNRKSRKQPLTKDVGYGLTRITTTQECGRVKTMTQFVGTKDIHRAPKILEKFIDDDGNEQYVLDNGNTQEATSFNLLWTPTKGKILPFGTK